MINDVLVKKLDGIKKEFGFKENFNLYEIVLEIPIRWNEYNNKYEESKAIRPSKIKIKLREKDKMLKKIIDLFTPPLIRALIKFNPLLFLHEEKFIKKMVNEDIPHFIEIIKSVNKINDKTGILSHSKNQFLVFQLLYIYVLGTNKDIKCGWDSINGTGTGEAYHFIIRFDQILPGINPQFTLSSSEKQIVNDILTLSKKYEHFEFCKHQ